MRLVKLFAAALCALALTACGDDGPAINAADLAGAWSSQDAELYFNEDGTYEIKYSDFAAGELSSENGKYELEPGKIKFRLRDKYTLDEYGDIKFERLIHTENREEDIALDGGLLTLDGREYSRRETD